MSGISRRALFGLGVGAVAAVKAPAVKAVGLDFGKEPAAPVFRGPFLYYREIDFGECYFYRSPRKEH